MNTTNQNNIDERRRKRVKRIKKIIVTLVIAVILLPTILSICLFAKTASLQKQLNELTSKIELPKATSVPSKAPVQSAKPAATEKVQETEAPTIMPTSTANQQKTNKKDLNKTVYLTFDDSPSANTNMILDVLAEENIKATFFVNGKEDKASKEIYKRIVKEGHTLGMHSYSHNTDKIYTSVKNFSQDLAQIYNLIAQTTGVTPEFYRFPGGSDNKESKVDVKQFISILSDRGITYLDWNVISPDVDNPDVSKEEIVNGIYTQVVNYNESIILFNDVVDRPMTVKALKPLIDKLKSENYTILPIDRQTALIRHNE